MHPYLGASILSLALAVVLFLAMKEQRLTMVVSGLLLVPFFPLASLFDDVYWLPARHGSRPVGVEDALFTFLSAALAWAIAVFPWRRTTRSSMRPSRVLVRAAAIHAAAVMAFLVARVAGAGPMTAYLLAHVPLVAVLLLLRPPLWRLAISGLVGYGAVYLIALRVFYALWPSFRAQWTAADAWGRIVLGVPLGDIAWAAVFGAGWPLLVAFACDAGVRETTGGTRAD